MLVTVLIVIIPIIITVILCFFLYKFLVTELEKRKEERLKELERAAADPELRKEFEVREKESIEKSFKVLRLVNPILNLFLLLIGILGTGILVVELFITKEFNPSNHNDSSLLVAPLILALSIYNLVRALD